MVAEEVAESISSMVAEEVVASTMELAPMPRVPINSRDNSFFI
ncbi:MAG: hypothetical protein RSD28_06875 [Lachnospiraceae bacterium]